MTRIIGYDPSSTVGGWAVVDGDEPIQIGIWKPSKSCLSPIQRLAEFDTFCRFLMAAYQPDIATVEVIRVSTSHDTTRALSRFEGVFIARAMAAGAEVIEYQVGQARAALFGDGLGTLQKNKHLLRCVPATQISHGCRRTKAVWINLMLLSLLFAGKRSKP